MNTIVVLRHPKVRKSFMQSPSSRPKDCVGPGFCVCFFNTSRAFWFRWIFQTTAQTRFLRVFKTIHKTKNSSSQFFVTPTAHRNNEHSSFCCACNPNVCCFHPHSRGCRSVVSLHAKWYGIPTYVWGREIRNREGNLRIPSSRCFACFAFKYRCSPVLVRHVLGRNLARPSQRPCWNAKALPWLLRLQLGQWNGMPDIYTLTKNFYFVLCNWLTLRFAWFRRFSGLKTVSTTAATTTAAQQLKINSFSSWPSRYKHCARFHTVFLFSFFPIAHHMLPAQLIAHTPMPGIRWTYRRLASGWTKQQPVSLLGLFLAFFLLLPKNHDFFRWFRLHNLTSDMCCVPPPSLWSCRCKEFCVTFGMKGDK